MSSFKLPTSVTKEAVTAKKKALVAKHEAIAQNKADEKKALDEAVCALVDPKIQEAVSSISADTLDLETFVEFVLDIEDLSSQYGSRKVFYAIDDHEYIGVIGGTVSKMPKQNTVTVKIPLSRLLDKIQDE